MNAVTSGTIRQRAFKAAANGAWSFSTSAHLSSVRGTVSEMTRSLPVVIKAPDDADLPVPLKTVSKSILGKKSIKYDNPWAPEATAKTMKDIWKLMRTGEMGAIPATEDVLRDLPMAEVELKAIASHGADDPMRVTWIGHATILVQVDGVNILTDPMFSERASANQMVGPKRFVPPAISLEALPKIDIVLLSHNHYDHLDSNSVKAIGDDPLWLVPMGLRG